MIYLIAKEYVLDANGKPDSCGVYLCEDESDLPEDAKVGSRAVMKSGKVYRKVPGGWGGNT